MIDKYTHASKKSFTFIVVLSSALALLLIFYVIMMFNINSHFDSNDISRIITLSIPFATLTSILSYLLSQIVKVYMSNKHMKADAEERLQLTRVYLSMLADENTRAVGIQDRQIVLNAIFSRRETGLLKHDGAPTMVANIGDLVKK